MNQPELITKAMTIARTEKAMRDWHTAAAQNFLVRDASDASVGLGNFTQGIPAFWFARSIEPGSGETLYTPYAQSAWVRGAIRHVTRPISSMDLVFSQPSNDAAMRRYKGRGQRLFTARGIVRRDEAAEVEMPEIRRFLRAPMAGMTYEDFVEASIGWYKLRECFWILPDQEARVPFPEVSKTPFPQIVVARPDRMRPNIQGGKIVAWNFTDAQGKVWELDPEQVVRFFGWNPYDPHRGLGDYESASVAAESHWLAGKFKRNLTGDNDTAPIISPKNGTPSDMQIEQIKMSIAERRAARMRGNSKALFMPGEVEVHDPKILSVDESFISGMLEDRHEIFVAFGVPPSLADVKASYSIGQASDWFALIQNTCIPEGGKYCAALEMLIYRLTGKEVEVGLNWDEHYVMQQVRSERMKDADSLFEKGVPMRTISDYLKLNLPDYEGDDVGYLPINMVPVESAQAIAESKISKDDYSEAPGGSGSDQNPDVEKMLRALEHRCDGHGPVTRSKKNEALWRAHMQLRSKALKLFQSKVSRLFNDYRVSALRKLEVAYKSRGVETKSIVDVIFDANLFGSDLKKNLDPVTRSVLQSAGDELFDEIGQPDDPWKMAPSKALEFIASRQNKLAGVGDTVFNQLKTSLDEGIKAGEPIDKLADRVRGVFNNLSRYESRRIAMTETGAAYGYARHEAMTDAGIEYKSWLSSHGPNVRPAHAQAEMDYSDSPIPVDEPFVVDGEELMYPGDDAGSAGNVINCQCIQIAVQPPKDSEGDEV